MQNKEIGASKDRLRFALAATLGLLAACPASGVQAADLLREPPHGPIYKTLDTLAGGIEKVIEIAASKGSRRSACDDVSCDDGCDMMTIEQLERDYPLQSPMVSDAVPIPNHSRDASPTLVPDVVGPMPSVKAPRMQQQIPPTQSATPMNPESSDSPFKNQKPRLPTPTPDDAWLDNFSPEPAPSRARRPEQTSPVQPSNRELRNPAETIDSLPNPFMDDPQSNRVERSLNKPASYWEPW